MIIYEKDLLTELFPAFADSKKNTQKDKRNCYKLFRWLYLSDLVGDAFEGMWEDMKIKPKNLLMLLKEAIMYKMLSRLVIDLKFNKEWLQLKNITCLELNNKFN